MFFNFLGSAPWAWYLVLLSRSAELRNRKCRCEVNSPTVLKPRNYSEPGKKSSAAHDPNNFLISLDRTDWVKNGGYVFVCACVYLGVYCTILYNIPYKQWIGECSRSRTGLLRSVACVIDASVFGFCNPRAGQTGARTNSLQWWANTRIRTDLQ